MQGTSEHVKEYRRMLGNYRKMEKDKNANPVAKRDVLNMLAILRSYIPEDETKKIDDGA